MLLFSNPKKGRISIAYKHPFCLKKSVEKSPKNLGNLHNSAAAPFRQILLVILPLPIYNNISLYHSDFVPKEASIWLRS